ncbi:MAG: SUF system NifU family Fe-S cluster assembly protein [Chloroflexi bacterium]|nr:SUF system NifU family Fe-S cluster assembly protein [Chloroflexota bacterium]
MFIKKKPETNRQKFDFEELDELYREVILAHYRNPQNRRQIEDADIRCEGFNPFCGDEVFIQLKLDEQEGVAEVGHQAQGCSICKASASMLTELLKGKTLEEAEALSRAFHRMMRGAPTSDEKANALGGLKAFQGVLKFPIRIQCALLPWAALESGLNEYRARIKDR